jgi:hypothetical protein
LKLEGQLNSCPECAASKAHCAKQFYLDNSSVKAKSFGGAKFWFLIGDHYTDYAWSAFLPRKEDLSDQLVRFLKSFCLIHPESADWPIIWCDNSGENVVLPNMMVANNLPVKFEFNRPGSPQYNGVYDP